MPPIFKALATIAAWVLFIWGLITMVSVTIAYYATVGINQDPGLSILFGWGLGTAELVLSVVVMKLRQMLE